MGITGLEDVGVQNRSSYYKWLQREKSSQELENEKVLHWIDELHDKYNGILGYRRMTMFLNSEYKSIT